MAVGNQHPLIERKGGFLYIGEKNRGASPWPLPSDLPLANKKTQKTNLNKTTQYTSTYISTNIYFSTYLYIKPPQRSIT